MASVLDQKVKYYPKKYLTFTNTFNIFYLPANFKLFLANLLILPKGDKTMIRSSCQIKSVVLYSLVLLLFFSLCYASDNPSKNLTYQLPPKIMADIVDAPPTPSVNIDPNGKWMLILGRPNLPSIEEVSQPKLRIAGIRINPKTNGPSRQWFYTSIKIKNIFSGEEKTVKLPEKLAICGR